MRRNGAPGIAGTGDAVHAWATHRWVTIGPCSTFGAARAAQLLSAASLRPLGGRGQTGVRGIRAEITKRRRSRGAALFAPGGQWPWPLPLPPFVAALELRGRPRGLPWPLHVRPRARALSEWACSLTAPPWLQFLPPTASTGRPRETALPWAFGLTSTSSSVVGSSAGSSFVGSHSAGGYSSAVSSAGSSAVPRRAPRLGVLGCALLVRRPRRQSWSRRPPVRLRAGLAVSAVASHSLTGHAVDVAAVVAVRRRRTRSLWAASDTEIVPSPSTSTARGIGRRSLVRDGFGRSSQSSSIAVAVDVFQCLSVVSTTAGSSGSDCRRDEGREDGRGGDDAADDEHERGKRAASRRRRSFSGA